MKHPPVNSSVFASVSALTALQKKAALLGLPQTKKQALTGTGISKSPFKTKGMDFSEVRQYQAGDDVRQIDWRVTAKYGKPFTKLYTDEKQRQVILVCDLRTSMKFATQGDFKSVLSAKMATFLAWTAIQKGNVLRSILILPDMLKATPIGSGTQVVSALLPELSEATHPLHLSQDIITFEQTISRVGSLAPKGASIFIFSDFHDITPSAVQSLGQISKKADVSLIHIFDTMEEKMPAAVLPITDGVHAFMADMQDKTNRKLFSDSFTKIQSIVGNAVNTYQLGYLPIRTDEAYIDMLSRYCEGKTT